MILCLAVTYFAAAVERRADERLKRRPLIIGGQAWEPGPVYAYSQEAARKGVRPGFSLRQAHLLFPDSHFLPAAQPRYQAAAGELVDLLTTVTSLLEPEALWHPQPPKEQNLPLNALTLPARYCLDLEGLPLPESLPLAGHLGRTARATTHLPPAIGLARDRFTARLAAYLARPHHIRAVRPGAEAAFLADRSIRHLPLPAETVRRLQLLGVRTLGQLAALPLVALQEQFGPAIEPVYRLARGEAPEPPPSGPTVPVIQATIHFAEPATGSLTAPAAYRRLATSLAGQLQPAGLASGSLTVTWADEVGQEQEATLALQPPTADPAVLQAALQNRLPAEQLGSAAWLAVKATAVVPAHARQLTLFSRPARAEQLWAAYGRLAAGDERNCFWHPLQTESNHPLPERRFALRPLALTTPAGSENKQLRPGGLLSSG